MTAAVLYWRAGGPSTSVGSSPTLSGSPTSVPTQISEPVPTFTPMPVTSPTAPNALLDVPASIRTNVPLPAGAQVDTFRLVADSDWLVTGITFPDSPTTETLYAANLRTGALREIRNASAFNSVPLEITVAGSRAAWADVTCESSWPSPTPTEQAHPLPQVQCSSWRVVLADLDTGASSVVAHGTNPEMVNDPMAQDTPVPVVPTVALGDDLLAYTTGDLTHDIKPNLLTLSSGATRTLPLSGPLEEMRWAGQDLAWVEDVGPQAAGTGPDAGAYANPYYLGSRLMVLQNGASARSIADGAYWLAADSGEIAWAVGGADIWTATSPGLAACSGWVFVGLWRAFRLGRLASVDRNLATAALPGPPAWRLRAACCPRWGGTFGRLAHLRFRAGAADGLCGDPDEARRRPAV